jgi:hypothetical protein
MASKISLATFAGTHLKDNPTFISSIHLATIFVGTAFIDRTKRAK